VIRTTPAGTTITTISPLVGDRPGIIPFAEEVDVGLFVVVVAVVDDDPVVVATDDVLHTPQPTPVV